MARKARIVAQDAAPRQAPWRLTAHEVSALMQTFTAGKCLIYESDALALGHWAEHRKRGAWEQALVLAGKVRVQVADGAVQLELSGSRN
jgi:hypothetical protein